MSILDMDVTTRRNAGSIRAREFATVRKGYDPDQVRSFLDHVATWLDDLETDLATARAEATAARSARSAAPAPPPPAPSPEAQDPYAALGTRVAELLRTAEDHAKRIRDEAEASSERMLEEARAESLRMRTRAQEEAEALRQAAQEHADVARRSAQEEADRVREEAANALETARVEAERTVAGLFERRSALAAELHATRSRLMGIVTQLEEESVDEDDIMSLEPPIVIASSEDAVTTEGEPEPASWAIPATSYIPPDDPRRDPVPPDLPSFVPPPPPKASFPPPLIEEIDGAISGSSDPSQESNGRIAPPAEPEVVAESAPDAEVAEAPAMEAAQPEAPGDEPIAPEPAAGAEDEADEAPPSFLQWKSDEDPSNQGLDMSLPDFPTIDIPSLEDEEHRRN